jgi:hypothetical protein
MNRRQEKKLALKLMNWHSSGGDPIYAVGSNLFAGKHPSCASLSGAARNLRRDTINRRYSGADLRELKMLAKKVGKMAERCSR